MFPQMSDQITSFRLGYALGREKEFWECGTSQESPEFVENPKDDHYDNLYSHGRQGLLNASHKRSSIGGDGVKGHDLR